MFSSVLVANRGEIALRIFRTARRMGLQCVAVYSEADRNARHVREADAAYCIGPAAPRESYLNIDSIIAAARATGAQAVHPGYGFLAENAGFAQAVLDAGLAWIGPSPEAIRAMGDKANAKRLAQAAGVPVLESFDPAGKIEYPVMIKAVAGGGGRGMRLVRTKDELAGLLASAKSEALASFGDDRVILERAVESPRHVEVQLLADSHGSIVHLGERDCSVQRRHQKLIEETPSPAVDAKLRARLGEAAIKVARSVGYSGAGTVECLVEVTPGRRGDFWFMEMNTRLQVEHPVTEAVTGLDLVEWQLRIAAGEKLGFGQSDLRFSGHAIEARLCAEDPARGFLPQAGRILLWKAPEGVRVEHALESGAEIPPHYDSMVAKVIAHAATRDEAREKLAAALDACVCLGVPTNAAYLAEVLREEVFSKGGATTALLGERFKDWQAPVPGGNVLAAAKALYAQACARDAGFGEWACWSNSGLLPAGPDVPNARDDRTLHFLMEGVSWTWRDASMDPPERAALGAADGRLIAPMNGKVAQVHVKAGDSVDTGSPLLVLEAMKMEHTLQAPAALRVKTVHVAKGAQVSPGQLLVEFEPSEAK
jgi:geranyl-CoA carboxylase alpha subunit